MQIRERRVFKHICEKCGTKYDFLNDAEKCEALKVPKPKFKAGDKVRIKGRTKGFWWWKKPVEAKIELVHGSVPPCALSRYLQIPVLSYSYANNCAFLKKYLVDCENLESHIFLYGVEGEIHKMNFVWFFEEDLGLA